MKKLLLLLLFSISVFSQKTAENFVSTKEKESWEITTGLAQSHEKITNIKYPILILLDGYFLFEPFYGALNHGDFWDGLPETIIMGISQNKNEERIDDGNYDKSIDLPSGRSAQFFEFIGGELRYIEKKYRIATFRITAGHNTTAGYLNFFLYKDNPIFNAYVSLSPELVPEMETRNPEIYSKLKQPFFYYQIRDDDGIKEIMESVKKLYKKIKIVVNPIMKYKYVAFKGTSHYCSAILKKAYWELDKLSELARKISKINTC